MHRQPDPNSRSRPITSLPRKDTKPAAETLIEERIWHAIVSRTLAPGTHLKEERLQEIFRVGRAKVRKALFKLSCDRLVDIIPNSGAFVAKPTIQNAREVFGARRLIEGELVRRLIARITIGDRSILEELIRTELEANQNGDFGEQIRLSGLFHIRLAEMADSPVLLGFLKELVPQTSLIIALYQVRDVGSCGPRDHQDMVELILAGNCDGAVALMNSHLERIEQQLNLRPTENRTADLATVLGNVTDHEATGTGG